MSKCERYDGSIPPCGALMRPLPLRWNATGKVEPFFFLPINNYYLSCIPQKRKNKKKASPASKTVKKVTRRQTLIPEQAVTLKAEEPQVRYLKVQPRHRYSPRHASIVPELRLNGRWLEKAGFDMACYASITVMDGLLIIRSAKEDK